MAVSRRCAVGAASSRDALPSRGWKPLLLRKSKDHFWLTADTPIARKAGSYRWKSRGSAWPKADTAIARMAGS